MFKMNFSFRLKSDCQNVPCRAPRRRCAWQLQRNYYLRQLSQVEAPPDDDNEAVTLAPDHGMKKTIISIDQTYSHGIRRSWAY